MQNDLWHFGEVAPLPTFHKISYDAALNDLINVFKNEQPPQFALTQTVFDIWETPTQEGSLSVNALLGSDADPTDSWERSKSKWVVGHWRKRSVGLPYYNKPIQIFDGE